MMDSTSGVFEKMKQYIALLRGINISGKNKLPMADLKTGLEGLLYKDVKTYLNSGNVIFSSAEDDTIQLMSQIETMIKKQFGLDIPVLVIKREALEDILCHAPGWWGNDNKEIYDNLIFILPPATFAEIYNVIGEPKKDLERIEHYKDVIFWSFSRKDYQKTNWWPRTAGAAAAPKLTIRTANTIRKIAGM